jgi:ElaB/YqjD/DUF883 family membrane-anchored ribosome-binding protein
MDNVAGAQAQAKNFAGQNFVSSDAEEIRDAIKDLGSSVGDMATRQYGRAQDTLTDSLQEAGSAVRRNPLTAIGIGLGVGFVLGLVTGGRSRPALPHSS